MPSNIKFIYLYLNIRMGENKNIIIYADININITDGSTIWLSNLINTLNMENKSVYFFNIYIIKNKNFNRNITNEDLFKIVDCDNIVDVKNKLESFFNQNVNNVENIIIRSKLIFDVIDSNWNILKYTTFYGLDIHLKDITGLNNKFKELWVQSDKLKELFVSNGVDGNKIKLTPPIAWKYEFDLPERTDNEIRLIYTGTLRDEENILEIIEEFKKIHEERPEVVLKIVYGKIHGNKEFVDKINQIIKGGVKGITFLHNLSHKDTCYHMTMSDIGICWRKNNWGVNGELSTKEKEYEMYGLEICKNNIFDKPFDFNLKSRTDDIIKFIFCDDLNHEFCEFLDNLNYLNKLQNKKLFLTICLKNDKNEYLNKINYEWITIKYNLSFKELCYEIATSDIGINLSNSTKKYLYIIYDLLIYKNKTDDLCNYLNIYFHPTNFNNINQLVIKKMINYKKQYYDITLFKNKFKVNFIIMNFSYLQKMNGYVNNEINVMINLTNIFEVYYNDVCVNDCIIDNNLNIELLNNKIISRINTSKKENFYDKYYGIFIPTNNYLITFFRCDNTEYLKKLFLIYKKPKVFSHNYNKQVWENECIGFQTNVAKYMIDNNVIHLLKDDGTLNYHNNNIIIPKETFIRYNFIPKFEKKYNNFLEGDFLKMCFVGNINKYTDYNFLLNIINDIEIEKDIKIKLIVMSNENIEIQNKNILNLNLKKNDYLNYLSNCDLLINTWNSDVILYSNSNKIFDCISTNIPIILPHSFSYYEILGETYKYYYRKKYRNVDIKEYIIDIYENKNKNNFSYNIKIDNYNNKILNQYTNQIFNTYLNYLKSEIHICLLGVSSGKRFYGGIATNLENYYIKFKNYNLNISAIMYDNYIKEYLYYDGIIHCPQKYIYNEINKVLSIKKNSIFILFSWIHKDVLNYLKKNNVKTILLNPGLLLDTQDTFILDDIKNNFSLKFSDIQLYSIENVDKVIYNSELSYNIVKKLNNNSFIFYYNNPFYSDKKCIEWNIRTYDIGFVVSNIKRKIKNFDLFYQIIINLKNKLNILIIGYDENINDIDYSKKINDIKKNHNVSLYYNLGNEECTNFIAKTKILINTSYFDCGPTTLFESIIFGSKYITSYNVGGTELLEKCEIVSNYDSIDDWINCINYNLNNELKRDNDKLHKEFNDINLFNLIK